VAEREGKKEKVVKEYEKEIGSRVECNLPLLFRFIM
jgi:hypothetical protein